MPELRIFYDLLSQPCRAVVLFLEANKIPYESVVISLAEGAHMKNEDLGKVNPRRTIPAMDDNGFHLSESGAILRYLAAKYKVPDHWYPSKFENRARVDEYLEWNDSNLRAGSSGFFYNKFARPKVFGLPADLVKAEEGKEKLEKAITTFESYFLSRGKFIGGDDISIADLKPLCELTQISMTDYKPYQDGSKVDVWMKNCKEILGPAYDKAHKFVNDVIEQGLFKSNS
ncbi:uncharacterized protein [Dysidea avara]|uniref:uncharacterized protein n=1 Tax=Dysidea avara TaxID=196820 RepID=UPI0033180410